MILLIGYGNRLRQDDGLGPALLDLAGARFAAPDLCTFEQQQLVPELAAELAAPGVTAALFLDAAPADAATPPGMVTVRQLLPTVDGSPLGHQLAPEELLTVARVLYGATPAAWLVTVAGENFGYGGELSAAVRSGLDEALAVVGTLLATIRGGAPATARSAGSRPG